MQSQRVTEIGSIFDFFCEDVSRVDYTWNVTDENGSSLLAFADLVFTKVDIFDTLGGDINWPLNTSKVVIVYFDTILSFEESNV